MRGMSVAPEEVARKIEAKIDRLLEPLVIEMRIMKWKPEYQAIIWEAIAHKALRRSIDAAAEKP
jgi:hypothetical protein